MNTCETTQNERICIWTYQLFTGLFIINRNKFELLNLKYLSIKKSFIVTYIIKVSIFKHTHTLENKARLVNC